VVRPAPSAIRSLLVLLFAGLWSVLSGWMPPQSVPQQRELTSARNVENGAANPATHRRENIVASDDRSGDVSAEELPEVEPLRVGSRAIRRQRAHEYRAFSSIERPSALARGPPTSRV
jgi:hypothetical protein